FEPAGIDACRFPAAERYNKPILPRPSTKCWSRAFWSPSHGHPPAWEAGSALLPSLLQTLLLSTAVHFPVATNCYVLGCNLRTSIQMSEASSSRAWSDCRHGDRLFACWHSARCQSLPSAFAFHHLQTQDVW